MKSPWQGTARRRLVQQGRASKRRTKIQRTEAERGASRLRPAMYWWASRLNVNLLLSGGVLHHRGAAGEFLSEFLGRLGKLYAVQVEPPDRRNALAFIPDSPLDLNL